MCLGNALPNHFAGISNLLPPSSKIHGVKTRIDPFFLTSRFCARRSRIPEVPTTLHLPFTSTDLLQHLWPDFREWFAWEVANGIWSTSHFGRPLRNLRAGGMAPSFGWRFSDERKRAGMTGR